MLFEIIFGIIAAAILVVWTRKKDISFWRFALVIGALIYVGFALVGQQWDWLPIEFGGVLLYSFFVFLSFRFSILFLALGWALHVVWDLALHFDGHPGYVPDWYPGACLGFDLLIAGYLVCFFLEKKRKTPSLR